MVLVVLKTIEKLVARPQAGNMSSVFGSLGRRPANKLVALLGQQTGQQILSSQWRYSVAGRPVGGVTVQLPQVASSGHRLPDFPPESGKYSFTVLAMSGWFKII